MEHTLVRVRFGALAAALIATLTAAVFAPASSSSPGTLGQLVGRRDPRCRV